MFSVNLQNQAGKNNSYISFGVSPWNYDLSQFFINTDLIAPTDSILLL